MQVRGDVDRAAVRHLRQHLLQVLRSGASAVLVDLSAVRACDCCALPVLDEVRRQLSACHGFFEVRGLNPGTLTGFDEATLREVFLAYRASPGVAQPWKPGRGGVTAACHDATRRLVQVCVALATGNRDNPTEPEAPSGSTGAAGAVTAQAGLAGVIGERLIEQCVDRVGVDAAAVLVVMPGRLPGRVGVVAASAERATLLAELGIVTGEGPATECLRDGEVVSVVDLADRALRWPHYTAAARHHELHAARALPLVAAPDPSRPATSIGALVMFSESTGPMAAADLIVAQAFADLAALALAAARGWPRPVMRGVIIAGIATTGRDRVTFERATGLLAQREKITAEEARARLLRHARNRDLHPTEVARGVLSGLIHTRDPNQTTARSPADRRDQPNDRQPCQSETL